MQRKFSIFHFPFSITSGFTLVELLVVIAIISMLAAVGVTLFSNSQAKARDNIRKNNLSQLVVALEAYLQKNYQYIPGSGSNCNTGSGTDTDAFYNPTTGIGPYFKGTIPTDPLTGVRYCYLPVNNGKSYRLFAKLENCQDSVIINPATCATDAYNYSLFSPDLTVAPAP